MAYEVLQSKVEFEGKLLRLRTDQLKHPGGHLQTLELVEHPGAVAIIPLDDEANILLVRQYRHPAGDVLLEIPAGTLNPNEDPLDCARRECREEIGMAPDELVSLGAGFMAPGYSTEYLHFFLARTLTQSPLTPDVDEDLEIQKVPLDRIWEEVTQGTIRDIKTIAGLALARSYLAHEGQ